ncbi:MAG TPA: PLP-dependent aminotransferase family protein [Planctomycetaceae bacterium]|nr:PLP-dependent aminotransferase family protein [Planctomycetaceae bacterium]
MIEVWGFKPRLQTCEIGIRMTSTSAQPVRLSQRWQWASRQAIGFLMAQAVDNPQVLSLAAGLVDPQSLPIAETREALEHLFADPVRARHALQYGTTAGSGRLRHQVIEHFAGLEGSTVSALGLRPEQLVLTTGSQQLLSLVGEILVDPGDIVLVAAPTYFAYLGTLEGLGARIVPIETDADGMRLESLERVLTELDRQGELSRVRFVYSVSYYENPSGISLSAERRKGLVDLARRWSRAHRIFVLEDAAYRELRYDGPELPSLWSCDPSRQHVIYAQTFSKSFSPGVRVGCGILPDELVRAVCDRKGNEDFGSSNFSQHLLTEVFDRGLYRPHVSLVQQACRAKRDTMLAAAQRHFGDLPVVTWVRPHGGLYVWMSLPKEVATGFDSRLFQVAVKEEQVMYVPGELCYAGPPEGRRRNEMRLSFGVQDATGLEEGMRRLANAVRRVLE